MFMLIIGSHVGFNKDKQLLGSVEESLGYGSNAFMFYTGAPQNTIRLPLNDLLTYEGMKLMKENNIDIENVVVHAPYIINLANTNDLDKYNFSIDFLVNECKRCEELGIKKMVLHPGSHVGCGVLNGINSIANGLNKILSCTTITILLETMAGKGTEVGRNFDEIKSIIERVEKQNQIGICLDTCHLSDAGYDIENFDIVIDELKKRELLDKVGCIHINDSKNIRDSHKDRHANLGYGNIGFDNLINVIYHKEFENVPKILETPWIGDFPPYKFEIEMIKNKKFNSNLEDDVKRYYS